MVEVVEWIKRCPRVFKMYINNYLWVQYKYYKWVIFAYGILTILILMLLDRTFPGPPSYNIVEFLRKLFEAERLKTFPQSVGIFLFFVLPFVFAFLLHTILNFKIISIDEKYILSSLNNRCGELVALANKWMALQCNEVAHMISGFNQGVPVKSSDIKKICNSLYELTSSKKVMATCLYEIDEIYSDPEKKQYMAGTATHIRKIKKFSFSRYLVTQKDPNNLFAEIPSDEAKWIVQIHYQNEMGLCIIKSNEFNEIVQRYGVRDTLLDILFFDGSLLFALETDIRGLNVLSIPTLECPGCRNVVEGKNILYVIDTKLELEDYGKLFADISTHAIDILAMISKNKWLTQYGIQT